MPQPITPARFCGVAALACVCLLHWGANNASAQSIRFRPNSREVIEARLEKYAGDNVQRGQTLKELFAEAGCNEPQLSEQTVKGSKIPNVVCLLPGTSGRVIIVGAHFDRSPEGDGVVDNWSGASLLPSLYEAIKTEPRRYTYVFVGFTDEEAGLVGSRFYAQRMSKQEVALTDAMVNMDTLGLTSTEVWVSRSDQKLTGALVYIGEQLKLPVTGVNVEQVGRTDSESFVQRKIPSITIHSLTQETWNDKILHTKKDQLSAMRLDDYYQTYRLVAAYLAFLDQVLGPAEGSSASR